MATKKRFDLDPHLIKCIGFLYASKNLRKGDKPPLQKVLETALFEKYGVKRNYSDFFQSQLPPREDAQSRRGQNENRDEVANIENVKPTHCLNKRRPRSEKNSLMESLLGLDSACKKCKQITVTSNNRLLECKECKELYHQECCQPKVFYYKGNWICANCKNAKMIKPISKDLKPTKIIQERTADVLSPRCTNVEPIKPLSPLGTTLMPNPNTEDVPTIIISDSDESLTQTPPTKRDETSFPRDNTDFYNHIVEKYGYLVDMTASYGANSTSPRSALPQHNFPERSRPNSIETNLKKHRCASEVSLNSEHLSANNFKSKSTWYDGCISEKTSKSVSEPLSNLAEISSHSNIPRVATDESNKRSRHNMTSKSTKIHQQCPQGSLHADSPATENYGASSGSFTLPYQPAEVRGIVREFGSSREMRKRYSPYSTNSTLSRPRLGKD